MGWPEQTADFERYYPTDTLVTGYDIIFFWVARMAFQARYFTKKAPFKDVLIHGLIRDENGLKMSKSLGNGVDPMDVIEEHGVDALRYFLTTNSTPGQDMRYMPDKVDASWNFINKIWNASRFVQMHTEGKQFDLKKAKLSQVDRHIINKFNHVIAEISKNMDRYDFALVGSTLTKFVWDDFCSWYIELSKSGLQSEDEDVVYASKATLYTMLKNIVIMLHPFMPFVTEEIYQSLINEQDSIMLESWPTAIDIDTEGLGQVDLLITAITGIRETRVTYDAKPSKALNVHLDITAAGVESLSPMVQTMLESMAKVSLVDVIDDSLQVPINGGTLHFIHDELVDKAALAEKLEKEKVKLEGEIKRCTSMLSNERFTSKAPAEKVQEEQDKLAEYKRQLDIVLGQLNQ